jgi:hypothetical protein
VRRIRRWRTLATAAAVAIVAVGGGAAVANALQPSAAPSGPGTAQTTAAWRRVTGTGAAGAHLTVRYRQQVWGTQMEVNVSGLHPGSVCEFQVVDASGGTSAVGGWTVWQDGSWYPASTWVGEKDLRTFEVTINGQVVVSARA